MIHANDAINGSIELVGAVFTWRNALQLWRDRAIKGVYWPMFVFFALWGVWNCGYYPSLGQWCSFVAAVVLVAGNLSWVGIACWLTWRTP